MAVRYAVASGNWSAPSTWDGLTTVPGVGDDVYLDNRTVTVDQNITVASIRTTNRGGATLGGGVTWSNAAYSITANIIAGTTIVLNLTATSGTAVLVGNVTGSATANISCISVSGAVNLNVTGAIASGTFGSNAWGISSTSAAGNLTVTGNIQGKAAANSQGVSWIAATARVINIVGTCFSPFAIGVSGGAHVMSVSVIDVSVATALVTVTYAVSGTLTVGSITGVGATALSLTAGGVATVNSGVSAGAASGILAQGTGSLTVNGNVVGGTSSSSIHGVFVSGNCTVTINGNSTGGPSGGGSGATGNNGTNISAAGATVTITGNALGVQANAAGQNSGAYNNSTSTLTIQGSAIAGLNNTVVSHGVVNASTGTLTVNEAIGNNYPLGGLTQLCYAVQNVSTSAADCKIGSVTVGTGGTYPVSGRHYFDMSATNFFKVYDGAGGTLQTFGDVAADYPVIANVRLGTSYDFGAKVGTLIVPPVGSVSLGVPVDATVGTALLTQQDIADAVGPLIAAFGS